MTPRDGYQCHPPWFDGLSSHIRRLFDNYDEGLQEPKKIVHPAVLLLEAVDFRLIIHRMTLVAMTAVQVNEYQFQINLANSQD